MTLGTEQRSALRARVERARELLVQELKDLLQGTYGLHHDGRREAAAALPELTDARKRETRELLERLLPDAPNSKDARTKFGSSFDALVRSIAFTHLNRLVAFKLMEHPTRGILKETVGRYTKSRGYLHTASENDELLALHERGEQAEAYARFLLVRCRELDEEIGVLFDPDDLASRVMPRHQALEEVLALINDEAIADVWEHDETLGWVYQYWTPKALRDEARNESPDHPRDAEEMAFRNQFYTPEYVVRFLTDNTLGRLWLEMKPDSELRDRCEYLLVRPGEKLPQRAKKDPRAIRVLDPACGSGHFLLYAFELLERIYIEAWDDTDLGPRLRKDYPEKQAFLATIPKLIVENNLFGIDIDRRAAQIATLALFAKAKARSRTERIAKSGIVCAAPLPGGRTQLDAFRDAAAKSGEGPAVLRVLEALWQRMELAGETGSLLRLERVIADLVADEKKKWREQKARFGEQQPLLPDVAATTRGTNLDFGDLRDASIFDADDPWRGVEDRIKTIFTEYAKAAAGAEGSHRHLFEHDGVEALRLVDVMRQRYDVVLMNPPFGGVTPASKAAIENAYASSKSDVFACFVERGVELSSGGFVGCISTEAGFFRRTLESWRRDVLLARTGLEQVAHLGDNVLDTAKVRVAAYVLRSGAPAPNRPATFIRVLEPDAREQRFAEAIRAERAGEPSSVVYHVAQRAFEPLPYAVFGYWCSDAIRGAFTGTLESLAQVRQGLATADDFRFLRLRWEVVGHVAGASPHWMPFAKGGEYSPYHDDVHLMVRYERAGGELAAFERAYIRNPNDYGRPGLTYPLRTNRRFAPRTMPAGCAFGHKGPAIFVSGNVEERLFALLGALNSRPFGYLLSMGTGMAEADDISNSYEVGLVQRMPMPAALLEDGALAAAARRAAALARAADFRDETAAAFALPFPARPGGLSDLASTIVVARDQECAAYAAVQREIEARVCEHYSFGAAERAEIETHLGPAHALEPYDESDTRSDIARAIVSWALGVVFGRWDVRLALGTRSHLAPSDPFAAITSLVPGMIPDATIPAEYPLMLDADGILVDDEGHPNDVVGRIRGVLRLVWGATAEPLEADICKALSVKSLRAYLVKTGPGGFWRHHVAAYSKGKQPPRRAPIYWLLQSQHAAYSIWLYYPHLDRDTLFKLLHERFVLGRIGRSRRAIETLRPGGARPAGMSKKDAKKLEDEQDALAELEQFERTIRAVVEMKDERGAIVGYDPHRDDGVIINAAPLHALIPWPYGGRRQSDLAKFWDEVVGGDHDWAHLAMRYWPDRVRAKCAKARHLAIAHGLERDLFPGEGP